MSAHVNDDEKYEHAWKQMASIKHTKPCNKNNENENNNTLNNQERNIMSERVREKSENDWTR